MLTDDQIQTAKERYGDLYQLSTELEEGGESVECVVHAPTRAQFSLFAKEAQGDVLKAMNNLFFGCLVDPQPATLKALFDRYPGLVISFAGRLMAIAKLNLEVAEKKL